MATDKAVLEALMADLSHSRQDDLPLSDVARNGPSFAPTRGNGTSHISKKKKIALQSGWGQPIRDEESQMVAGLDLEAGNYRLQHVNTFRPPSGAFAHSGENHGRGTRTRIIDHLGLGPKSPALKQLKSVLQGDRVPSTFGKTNSQTLHANIKPDKTTGSHVSSPRANAAMVQSSVSRDPASNPQDTETSLKTKTKEAMKASIYTMLDVCILQGPHLQEPLPQSCICYDGRCMVFPNALSQDINFIAKFEMTIVDGGTSGKITFSADGHSTLVHDVLELEAPTPHGKFCVLHYPQGDVRYFLQLKDEKETIKFSGCLQGLQRSIREYRQNSTAQPTEITTESLIETSKEATTDLIDADLLQRWTGETFDHMWNMTNKMAAKLGTKGWKDDHHIANEIDGALTQKWIEHGLSRDKSDGCRGALLDVLRSLVTLKLNSTNVATSTTQQHVPDSMRMMMEPIRYTMKDLKRLRPCATKCPGEIQGADFLPMSGNIISARSRIRCQGEEPQSPKSVSIPRTNNVSSGHPSNNDLSALEVLLVNKATSSTTADSKHPPVNKWEALESTHERKEEQISSQSSVPRVAQAPLPVVPVAVSTETIENDAPDRAPAKVPEKKHRVTKGLASSIYAR